MKLIGFNFKKISAEKIKDLSGDIKFNTHIDISSIEPLKSDILKIKEDILKADFSYKVLYDPGFVKLEIEGTILLSVESKVSREILKDFKDKKINEDLRIFLFNIILVKSNIKMLQLEEELNIPPHISLPTIIKNKPKDEKDNK